MKNGDRIKWVYQTRNNGNSAFTEKADIGEFTRLIKHSKGYTGAQKAVILLDHMFRPITVPLFEVVEFRI